jgi:hypothetical protein
MSTEAHKSQQRRTTGSDAEHTFRHGQFSSRLVMMTGRCLFTHKFINSSEST